MKKKLPKKLTPLLAIVLVALSLIFGVPLATDDAPGRTWTECDIGTLGKSSRGAKRIVFSNDGLIYYTEDHYESFILLYGEE